MIIFSHHELRRKVMPRLVEYPFGFSPILKHILLNQVGGIPPDINEALRNILKECKLDVAAGNLDKTLHLVVDTRLRERMESNLDLPPKFFVEFHASLPEDNRIAAMSLSALPSVRRDARIEQMKRTDFATRVAQECVEGVLRIEVKPPDKIAVIPCHIYITSTTESPLMKIDYYQAFYCLPEEADEQYYLLSRKIADIYARVKQIDFTAEPKKLYELPEED